MTPQDAKAGPRAHISIHSFILAFIQQIFIEHPLLARNPSTETFFFVSLLGLWEESKILSASLKI